ncbi:helix-turn-helix domain-containing protein [Salmonella enterica]|nr:AraC family transcriptional regulator [Salmonella enterica subsp. enterica serovar Sandiego]EEC0251391.1 helix-turn-helix domain-containing protein [Salmonella enterica subsp. enterica]EJW2128703.1 helix-turn-helix domain-containing protein [Salmonella enterica]EEE4266586.1 helix-turn-helix domain-containing protein [Salmonella enterica subsp. enterica serovar Sandiego]EKT1704595.1 helix-turn-helix domain-containing protein [Salmonella enterica]
MPALHLLLVPSLQSHGVIKGPRVLLTTEPVSEEGYLFSYSNQQLYPIYNELQHLMEEDGYNFSSQPALSVAMDPDLLQALYHLGQADDEVMLRLVLAYALMVERHRCSALLRQVIGVYTDFFEILYRHRLKPWPVASYAALCGLSQRKFNDLFREKFGMSPKQWLQQQRLEHAKMLLETTSNKVIDVALESGFCNASHFSECFRRYFNQAPSKIRRNASEL